MSTTAPSPIADHIRVDTEINSSDFDPCIGEDERRFYIKAYPNIEMVRDRKVHCTTCKVHIGTAPSQESSIKMHPILRVTHCNKCHDFYNSGEFSKGEDGSELYCRWCGQGGEVYCCSNCPFVFCKSCIVKNLSRGVVADIEQNENWSCFNCAPKILWPLRAQHWALIKYIEKQKKAIAAMNLSESEMKPLLAKDQSTCCRLAKAKCGNMSDSVESIDSLSRRSVSAMSTGSTGKKLSKIAPRSQSPASKRPKPNNDEVVCTPDLLSMLEPDCQITVSVKPRPSQSPVASSPKVMSIPNPSLYGGGNSPLSIPNKNTPPPLVLRNTSVQMRPVTPTPIVRRTVVGSRTPTATGNSTPVYHTINGYRIDLNTASQQETFRLPNGKLIQVKRQGSTSTTTAQTPSSWQRNINMSHTARPVKIAPAQPHISQHYSQITLPQQHIPSQHPQVLRYQNTTMGNATVTAIQNGSPAQLHAINGTQSTLTQHPVTAQPPQHQHLPQSHQPQPQLVPQVAARPVMMRLAFPDTGLGRARSQLQDQVFNAMEICQHLTGKVQTLTNSNAYKQVRNYLDVKELYIHLSYLLTYAIGRFKGLQDKCLDDMRQLGFVNDADSLENGQLAAGVDYVRYGKLDDVELFSAGPNSFQNQIYEYRKSLIANLENDLEVGCMDDPSLSPLYSLRSCFAENVTDLTKEKLTADDQEAESQQNSKDGKDGNDPQGPEEINLPQKQQQATTLDEDNLYNSYFEATGDNEDYNQSIDCDDRTDISRPSASNESYRHENESHNIDHKLTLLIEQYPSIWCTRHPDYGSLEISRKHWRRISSHFKEEDNIKMRWKNIRKRFVRIEEKLKRGKQFSGYYDKATNFLFNRNLPECDWAEVDKGESQFRPRPTNDEDGNSWAKKMNLNTSKYNDVEDDHNDDSTSLHNISVTPLEISKNDLRIINFVKCNPVLWRKSSNPTTYKIDQQTRKGLWNHLWKQIPATNCEKLADRWSHLYELYKTFRLKHIKNENLMANLEMKYSKYLAKLHFLYKIDEDDLRKEDFNLMDCGNLNDLPEHDLKMQEMPDDRAFVLALTRAVFARKVLWNPKHRNYDDPACREDKWAQVQDELKEFKRDIQTIKLRWNLAKFCYLRLCRDKRKYSEGELPKYCGNLPVDELKFLKLH